MGTYFDSDYCIIIYNLVLGGVMKINTREENYCILCKYWLGEKIKYNFVTGQGNLVKTTGLCSQKKDNVQYNSDSLCSAFERALRYC